jgi:hypothetical protein
LLPHSEVYAGGMDAYSETGKDDAVSRGLVTYLVVGSGGSGRTGGGDEGGELYRALAYVGEENCVDELGLEVCAALHIAGGAPAIHDLSMEVGAGLLGIVPRYVLSSDGPAGFSLEASAVAAARRRRRHTNSPRSAVTTMTSTPTITPAIRPAGCEEEFVLLTGVVGATMVTVGIVTVGLELSLVVVCDSVAFWMLDDVVLWLLDGAVSSKVYSA